MADENKKIFNNLSKTYNNLWVNDKEEKKRIEKIVDKFGIKKGMKILEAGCGSGEFTPFILKKTGKKGCIYLVDIADKMLLMARKRLKKNKNIKYLNCCASKIPVNDELFDMIVVFNSFPHFFPKEKFIREFSRVLGKNGSLVIAHDLPRQKINKMHNDANFNMNKNLLPGKREMFKMLTKQGFVIRKYLNKEYYFLKAIKQIYYSFLVANFILSNLK